MSLGISTAVQRLPANIRAASGYNVGGAYPKLAFDFKDEYYRVKGGQASFSDAMTFSRNGNATMVDSDGLIKWAPHNLQTDSQNFSGASWSTSNATVTANSTDAPDGTATADKIEQIVSGDWRIVSTNSIVDAGYTYGIFLKTVSGTGSIGIRIYDGSSFSDQLCSVTNEWQLFAVSSSGTTQNIYIDSRVSGSDLTEVYAWGAHLYRSDLGGMVDNPDRGDSYVPTTSSAVYLPRRGHHKYNGDTWVNKGVLVESEARSNVLVASDFSAYFGTSGATISTDATTSPDGNISAVEIIEAVGSSAHYISTNVTVTASVNQTLSVYVKQGSGSRSAILRTNNTGSGHYAVFDFASETITETGVFVLSSTSEKMGNGWYRISFTYLQNATTASGFIVGLSDSATPSSSLPSYTGDGTSSIYIYGGQFESGYSTPSSYIPTSGASVTRAAETITVPYANLPWPTPTYIGDELVTNGTFDTDLTGWTAGGVDVASITWNSGQADIAGNSYLSQQLTGLTAGAVYQIKASVTETNSQGSIRIGTSSNAGDLYDSPTFNSAVEYELFIVPSGTGLWITLKNEASVGVTSEYSLWDNISVREINPLSVSIAMDGEMTYADDDLPSQVVFINWEVDSSNYIKCRVNTSSTRTGEFNAYQKESGVVDLTNTASNYYSPDILIPYNNASRHGSTFINLATDGIALTADTTPVALPDLSTTDLDLAFDYMGTISSFRIWDRDIGDAGLEAATEPSLEASLSLTFDGQPSSYTNGSLVV